MNTEFYPVQITRQGAAAITILWNDGEQSQWTAVELRRACPCASCREKHRGDTAKSSSTGGGLNLPVLSAAEARPLRIESMRPVGNYAYNIAFSDGHASGVYRFEVLRR